MANTKRIRQNQSVDGNLTVAGDTSVVDLAASGDVTADGDVNVAGAVNADSVNSTNPIQSDSELKLKKISSPSSPASGYVSVYSKSDDALYYKNSSGSEKKVAQETGPQAAWVQDLKADGVAGGDGSATTWNTRDLNSLLNPFSVSWISVATNQITLTSGKYIIEGQAPVANANGPQIQHQTRLYNITDSSTALLGTTGNLDTAASTSASDYSFISGGISIAGTKVFELQHWISATGSAGSDFGIFAGSGAGEVYSQLKITRVGD